MLDNVYSGIDLFDIVRQLAANKLVHGGQSVLLLKMASAKP